MNLLFADESESRVSLKVLATLVRFGHSLLITVIYEIQNILSSIRKILKLYKRRSGYLYRYL